MSFSSEWVPAWLNRGQQEMNTVVSSWRRGVVIDWLIDWLYQRSYSTSSPVSTGMRDVSGFDSRRRHFISVCNQPPRSTQPFILSRSINWVVKAVIGCLLPRTGGAIRWMLTGWMPGVVDWGGGVCCSCSIALPHHWLLPINCHFPYSAAGRGIAA